MSAAKWNLQRNVANARSGRMALQCRGSDDELIATFPGCDRDEANARLIAAAPDLLDALSEFLDERSTHKLTETERLQKARAAVAKATGEQA